MRKVLTTLVAVALAGAAVLAVTSLAGAKPGSDKTKGKSGQKAERVLFAKLNGRKEIGPDGKRGAGDPDGRGGFTALVADDQVCFGLTVDNIEAPTAAHIHRGRPGKNGPIEVTLTAPSAGDPGTSSDCVAPDGGDTAVLAEIIKHSGRFYVNVHNSAFPDGAIRGQLRHRRP